MINVKPIGQYKGNLNREQFLRIEKMIQRLSSNDSDGFTLTFEQDDNTLFLTIYNSDSDVEDYTSFKATDEAVVRGLEKFLDEINYVV